MAHRPRPRRLPIHLYMTKAIRTRIKNLDVQYSRMIDAMTAKQLGETLPPELPDPQVVAITLSGRILTEMHIKVRGT